MRILIVGFTLAFMSVIAAAQAPRLKPAAPRSVSKPTGTLAQVMRGIYFPNANLIRIARAAATLVLVVAFGTLPMAIDWCAASCEAAHTTGASPAAPPCHHTTSPTSHLGHMPTPCGHDHHAALVMTAGGRTVAARPSIAGVAVFATPALRAVAAMTGRVDGPRLHPPQDSIPLALSASLRI